MKIIKSLFAVATLAAMSTPAMANGIISNPGRYDGGRLSVQTQRGTNCSSSAPDRASFSVVAGYRGNDYEYSYAGDRGYRGSPDNGEFVGGAVVTIPFGGPDFGNCSNLLEMEEARARLDMATTLFEAGAMEAEELRAVAEEVKGIIGKQQGTLTMKSEPKESATVKRD